MNQIKVLAILKKRVDFSQQLVNLRLHFELVSNLVIGDENWSLCVNFKRKVQNQVKQQSQLQNQVYIPKKRILSIWWGVKGVINWELLPER